MPAHYSPSAERNAGPILEFLRSELAARGDALEIASGPGQHAAAFAAALPGWSWQPSDWQDDAFLSVAEWAEISGARNVQTPVLLDVRASQWPEGEPKFGQDFDLVFCANMLHIAPWQCCAGLMQGAARYLRADGRLVVYGPFLESDVVTSPSNAAFDANLRMRDPAWGLRHLDDVRREASDAGMVMLSRQTMPAHNLLLLFGRQAS